MKEELYNPRLTAREAWRYCFRDYCYDESGTVKLMMTGRYKKKYRVLSHVLNIFVNLLMYASFYISLSELREIREFRERNLFLYIVIIFSVFALVFFLFDILFTLLYMKRCQYTRYEKNMGTEIEPIEQIMPPYEVHKNNQRW